MFKNRTLLIRVALIGVALLLLWGFMSNTKPNALLAGERISYSQMLQHVEKKEIDQARFDPYTGELVAMLKPISPLPAPVEEAPKPVADEKASAPVATTPAPSKKAPVRSVPATTGQRTVNAVLPPDDTSTLKALAATAELTVSERPRSSAWGPLLFSLIPVLLLIAFFWWFMRRQGSGPNGQAMGFGKSKVQAVDPANNHARMADVAGCDEAKEEIQEVIDFLKAPDRFISVGGKMPHGILLEGPPGTGKTLLAKAVAGEAKVPFFFTSGSDFVEMFVGVGAARVRDTFAQARAQAPSIIFIDEIDAIGRQRSAGPQGGNDEREQTLNQLLIEMDGFKGNDGVIVIAATNRSDMLDSALKRAGRFDRDITVGLPDRAGRAKILSVHARKVAVDVNVDWDLIARGTPGFSGADLANLINEAALAAARAGAKLVTNDHLEWARDRVMMGAEKLSAVKNEKERRITAYHEAGHALVARFIEGADPVHKITIVPRGRALGLTMQLPKEDAMNLDKDGLTTQIAVLMGGRAAEDVALNVCTAGASNDFSRAATIARRMVASWGMDDEIGPVSLDGEYGHQPGYDNGWSDSWKQRVDNTVAKLLRDQYARACQLLRDNRDALERVSLALLDKETLDAAEFERLVTSVAEPELDTPQPLSA